MVGIQSWIGAVGQRAGAGLGGAFTVSASGMAAHRLRLDLIAQNIANAESTRSADGGPYKRKMAVFREVASLGGVEVAGVARDASEPRRVYDPQHPDADASGYVAYPNVDVVREMVDMISATRAYEACVTSFNTAKAMAEKALEIGRR